MFLVYVPIPRHHVQSSGNIFVDMFSIVLTMILLFALYKFTFWYFKKNL